MARRKKDPLRELTEQEKTLLETLARARSAPADQSKRAMGLLAVAQGKSYKDAAQFCRQAQGTTVAGWVARFNTEGIAAVVPRHSGHRPQFTGEVKGKILDTFRRAPDPERDGTATWSITTLQKALGREGTVLSGYSLWGLLREEGYNIHKFITRSHTGESKRRRRRKGGTVVETVVAPDTEVKKN